MEGTIAHAPGRVELLGNHTDYNQGLVLAAALDRGVTVRGQRRDDPRILLSSLALEMALDLPLDDFLPQQGARAWANHPLGVVRLFGGAGYELGGFSMEIVSDLPMGAGLSSSAALQVATATLLKKLFRWEIEPMKLARLCRRAENEFVGVQCGLLDQASAVFGREDCAILLDCRDETVEHARLPPDVALLIATPEHSWHVHAESAYNERRACCFAAAQKLGAGSLREVTLEDLEDARGKLTDAEYRRALHVAGEIERVRGGVEFLEKGDAGGFGALMYASHESSRLNFENSTPDLDLLVRLASALPGVHGARLTGGGFGGSVLVLAEAGKAPSIASALEERFQKETGVPCATCLCRTDDGAR